VFAITEHSLNFLCRTVVYGRQTVQYFHRYLLSSVLIGPPHLVTSRYVRRHLVRPGDRLRLPCPVRANPPALVTWYKDGGTIHLGWDRYRVRADDWTLSVRDVQLDDTGIFTCRATNGFGSIDITYLVYVSRKLMPT